MSMNTYVGPYIALSGEIEIDTEISCCANKSCSKFSKSNHHDRFCPACGSRIDQEFLIKESNTIGLWTLEDLGLVDEDQFFQPEYLNVILSNKSELPGIAKGHLDEQNNYTFDMTNCDPKDQVSKFKNLSEVSELLNGMDEHNISYYVGYGAILYCM